MDRQESSAPYIWVSFDFRNQDPVIPLLERMRQEGLPVQWKNGEMKWEDITSCIKESDQVIIFLSEAYLNSTENRRTLAYIRDLEKNLLLIYLDDVELPHGLAMRIGRNQAIFYSKYKNQDAFLQKVFDSPQIRSFIDDVMHMDEDSSVSGFNPRKKRTRGWAAAVLAAVVLGALAWTSFFGSSDDQKQQNNVLLNDSQLTVSVQEMQIEGKMLEVALQIENKTEESVQLSIDDGYLNRFRVNADWSGYILPGQITAADVILDIPEWMSSESLGISSVELILSGKYNGDLGFVEDTLLGYYPMGVEKIGSISYPAVESDQIIADTQAIYACVVGSRYAEEQGEWIHELLLVNRTQDEIIFSVTEESLNGYGYATGWSETVRPGCAQISEITIPALLLSKIKDEEGLAYAANLHADGEENGETGEIPFALHMKGEPIPDDLEIQNEESEIFENGGLKLTYLGVIPYGSQGMADAFILYNQTKFLRDVDIQMQVDNEMQSYYTKTATLQPNGECIITFQRANGYGESGCDGQITMQIQNRELNQTQNVSSITVHLAPDLIS